MYIQFYKKKLLNANAELQINQLSFGIYWFSKNHFRVPFKLFLAFYISFRANLDHSLTILNTLNCLIRNLTQTHESFRHRRADIWTGKSYIALYDKLLCKINYTPCFFFYLKHSTLCGVYLFNLFNLYS